ncbi:MAG: DNA translocase FtsK 4TM domain-containing protein, partial [Paracoccaceae bacterium]
MASYQTRGRDPLLDSNMQAAIEKRGKELIGILLIILGVAVAAMVGSYTPDDPNWMVSTDAPVQNWLGRPGASIAAPLFMIVGWASWGIALVLLAWGVRFVLHISEERAINRLIFAPIAVALASVYCATLIPGEAWRATHSFGLGGLFGDTIMGAFLTLLPVGSSFAVKMMSLISAVSMLALGAYVLGFTGQDIRKGLRFALVGFIMLYGALVTLTGRGATRAVQAAKERKASRTERRAVLQAEQAQAQAEAAALAAQVLVHEDEPEPERTGLLARMPALIRRPEPMPEPELVEQPGPAHAPEDMPGDDRIRAKIADVIKARHTPAEPEPAPIPADKPLTKGRGHGPRPLLLDPVEEAEMAIDVLDEDEMELRPEPPISHAAGLG